LSYALRLILDEITKRLRIRGRQREEAAEREIVRVPAAILKRIEDKPLGAREVTKFFRERCVGRNGLVDEHFKSR
jgi:hypothetical protein